MVPSFVVSGAGEVVGPLLLWWRSAARARAESEGEGDGEGEGGEAEGEVAEPEPSPGAVSPDGPDDGGGGVTAPCLDGRAAPVVL